MSTNDLFDYEMLEQIAYALRNDGARLKLNTDYCWMVKYGTLHILTNKLYEDYIKEELEYFKINSFHIHTFSV